MILDAVHNGSVCLVGERAWSTSNKHSTAYRSRASCLNAGSTVNDKGNEYYMQFVWTAEQQLVETLLIVNLMTCRFQEFTCFTQQNDLKSAYIPCEVWTH